MYLLIINFYLLVTASLKIYRSVLIKGKKKRRDSGGSDSRSHQNSPTELKDRSKWDCRGGVHAPVRGCSYLSGLENRGLLLRRKLFYWQRICWNNKQNSEFSGKVACPSSHSFEANGVEGFSPGDLEVLGRNLARQGLACELKPRYGNSVPNCFCAPLSAGLRS